MVPKLIKAESAPEEVICPEFVSSGIIPVALLKMAIELEDDTVPVALFIKSVMLPKFNREG